MIDRMKKNPSPQEVEESVNRLEGYKKKTTVEVKLGKHWRAVRVTELRSLPNKIKPELTVLFFKPDLLVSTPSLPELDSWIALTLEGANKNRCTLMRNVNMENPREAMGRGVTVGFRYRSPEAKSFIQQQLAKAMGMRYRNKKLVDPSKYEYTKKP